MKVKLLGAMILSGLFVMTVPVTAMAEDTMSSTDTMQAPMDNGTNSMPNNVGATPPSVPAPSSTGSANDDMNADTATGDDDY